jgi:hypothetical protein
MPKIFVFGLGDVDGVGFVPLPPPIAAAKGLKDDDGVGAVSSSAFRLKAPRLPNELDGEGAGAEFGCLIRSRKLEPEVVGLVLLPVPVPKPPRPLKDGALGFGAGAGATPKAGAEGFGAGAGATPKDGVDGAVCVGAEAKTDGH